MATVNQINNLGRNSYGIDVTQLGPAMHSKLESSFILSDNKIQAQGVEYSVASAGNICQSIKYIMIAYMTLTQLS